VAVLVVLDRIDIQRIVELRGITHRTIVSKQRVEGGVDALGRLAEHAALLILEGIELVFGGLGLVEGGP